MTAVQGRYARDGLHFGFPKRNGAITLFAVALIVQVVCFVVLAGKPAQAQWQGTETLKDGVVQVHNLATPQHAPLTMDLEELWRIGGDSEDPGEFFGLITDIAIESTGEVYLLDRQLCEVKVFSAEGEYLRTVGREGEGPGEFRRPSSLFFMPSGDLAVVRSRPSGVVLLTPNGDPVDPFPMPSSEDGGFRAVQSGSFRGGSLVFLGNNFRRSEGSFERTTALVRMDMQGNEVARFYEQSNTFGMASVVIRETETSNIPWNVQSDGKVVASLDFDYRIHRWNSDGTLERVMTIDYDPRMRSGKQKEKRQKELGGQMRGRGRRRSRPEIKVEVAEKDRDIQWLQATDDGSLWVLPSRGALDATAGSIGQFDVFDRDGHYFQAVTLRGDADFLEDRIIMMADRLFVIKQFAAASRAMRGTEVEDEDLEADDLGEPMSVICYRFEWTPQRAVAAPTQ